MALPPYCDNVPADTPPGELFHYTTAAGAIGIIQERVIWATSIANLNDALEGQHFRSLAIEAVKSRSAEDDVARLEMFSPMHDPRTRAKRSYELMLKVLSQEQAVGATNIDRDKWPSLTCVASFTLRDDLLSQWRAYSGSGIGFQIGFDPKKLNRRREATVRQDRAEAAEKDGFHLDLNAPILPSYFERFNWYRCRYVEAEQRGLIETEIDRVLRIGDSSTDFDVDTMLGATRRFAMLAAICKNESFHEEREWRIVMHDPPQVFFRTGIGGVVPYAKVQLDDDHTMPGDSSLVSIRVGPGHDRLLAAQSIQQCMLRSADSNKRQKPPLLFAPVLSSCSLRT